MTTYHIITVNTMLKPNKTDSVKNMQYFVKFEDFWILKFVYRQIISYVAFLLLAFLVYFLCIHCNAKFIFFWMRKFLKDYKNRRVNADSFLNFAFVSDRTGAEERAIMQNTHRWFEKLSLKQFWFDI